MPTQMKSAPFSNAYLNPDSGLMAPAARTLKAIHGFETSNQNPVHAFRYLKNFIAVTGFVPQVICVQHQRVQNVLQVMSDAGRHLAERAKLLRPDQRILGCAEIVKRLLKFLMLICLVEADCGKFRQAFDQRRLPLIQRLRCRVQNNEGAE